MHDIGPFAQREIPLNKEEVKSLWKCYFKEKAPKICGKGVGC